MKITKNFTLFFCAVFILASYNYITFDQEEQIDTIDYMGENNPDSFGEHPEITENPDIDPYYNEDIHGNLQ